ncbi:MAG: carbohydrate binding family 9 domain-containing protein, partial [Flavobacteriaceae bacterium]|nr:carbohydrate binding family 9 domain-containing protein [Flavobacteriaceae bacterium]
MKKYLLIIFLVGFVITEINAQKKNENFRLNIRKTTLPITVDGVANDKAWLGADVIDNFFMVLPMDTAKATARTEVRMTYDDKNIYLIATFYNSISGPNIVESLRRDFTFGKNDNFLIFIDPFNNKTTGFSFGTNAAGAQWDGTMYAGGRVDLNWDSKWISEVKQYDDKWVFEMALPFKSIRYKKGVTEWGINFSRLDLKSSEKSSWTPIPRQFPTASLAYTGVLVWDSPPPPQGANISIIPYVLARTGKLIDNESANKTKIGGDIKVSLTSSINLDLTINPDFSQVEVDRQVTNLDRFELFFPEKRQFFLENADLFANFGYHSVRPFFSRRIGLGVPIIGGARVSGNIDEKWRLGIMDMQTESDSEQGLPNQNFGVLSLQRQVFSRSSIGLMFVNKQSFNYPDDTDEWRAVYPEYNRNLGLEYNLASSNNLFTGKAFFLKSFSPTKQNTGVTQAAHLEYKSKKWNWRIQEESVDENYSAEVGFVPRKGYVNINSSLGHLFFPKKGQVLSHGPTVRSSYYFNQRMEQTDHSSEIEYKVNFRNRSGFELELKDEFVELLEPFDPTGSGKDSLATGTKHRWKAFTLEYNSKPQSMFTYAMRSYVGGYYADGNRVSLSSEIGYRFQPYVSLSGNISY